MNTKTQTKTASLSLLPQFVMSKEDIETLNNLPSNMPDTNLTVKQKDLVNSLYHKYISGNGVTYGWGRDIYHLEMNEKWPSGGKVKTHEAKRMVLGWLLNYTLNKQVIEGKEALDFLMTELVCREADQILVKKIYQIK